VTAVRKRGGGRRGPRSGSRGQAVFFFFLLCCVDSFQKSRSVATGGRKVEVCRVSWGEGVRDGERAQEREPEEEGSRRREKKPR
jgi:hypothetical protein